MDKKLKKQLFFKGFKDGIPIGLGYFAVAFSLGIAARNAGLDALQGFIASLLMSASAGEYAGFNAIRDQVGPMTVVLVTIIANARYLLMSCALSQRLRPNMPFGHRLMLGFYLTDELFGITIARPGYVEPVYTYGATLFAVPCWAVGTAAGIIVGNLLPENVISALSVALYGMFLAIIIPPARKNRIVALLVAASFVLSFAFSRIPGLSSISEGTRIIILTLVLSAAAALIFPVKDDVNASAGEQQ